MEREDANGLRTQQSRRCLQLLQCPGLIWRGIHDGEHPPSCLLPCSRSALGRRTDCRALGPFYNSVRGGGMNSRSQPSPTARRQLQARRPPLIHIDFRHHTASFSVCPSESQARSIKLCVLQRFNVSGAVFVDAG